MGTTRIITDISRLVGSNFPRCASARNDPLEPIAPYGFTVSDVFRRSARRELAAQTGHCNHIIAVTPWAEGLRSHL
jgi:hypothetical protein